MELKEYEWDILGQKTPFWKGTLWRSLVLLPMFGAASYGNVVLSSKQIYLKADELLVFLEVTALGIMVLINYGWHQLYMAWPPKLIHFKISAEGIWRDTKNYPLTAFRNSSIDEMLKKVSLPAAEWHQPRPYGGKPLELLLLTNQGKVKLEFPEEYARQQFISTLQTYLRS